MDSAQARPSLPEGAGDIRRRNRNRTTQPPAQTEADARARPGLPTHAVGGAAAGAREGNNNDLPGNAVGGAARARNDNNDRQPPPANHDDTDEPERYINRQVLLQTGILIIIRGLGTLLLLWSTVVLLGGFVSILLIIDFDFITIISALLSVRVFNALVDEQYKYLCDWVKSKYTKKEKDSANATVASGSQLVFIQIMYIILLAFPMLVYIVHIVLSSVRLKVYGHKLGEAATTSSESSNDKVKMNLACFGFYFLSLIQSVLYLVWYSLDMVISSSIVEMTVKKCEFPDLWGKDCVLQYLASTKSKCLNDPKAERSLVKFASGLLDSDTDDDLLSGARMVNHFLEYNKLPVQELIRSSRSRVEKLLIMLAWKQSDDREIRLLAAKIVAHVARDMDIAQFPGTLGCISSLIDPSEGNFSLYASAEIDAAKRDEELHRFELIQQGFSILDKLTDDDKHNCIQILQDQALLTHIIAWVRSKPFIRSNTVPGDYWEPILRPCLDVLVRLTSLPEQEASQLDQMIKMQVPIFISGYGKHPELGAKLIQMFANVCLHEDEENNETGERFLATREMFLEEIWGIFLSCRRGDPDNVILDTSKKENVIATAGEALSMLSAKEINCRALYRLDNGITGKLGTIMKNKKFSIVYRSLAAEINGRLYNNTILKQHIYGDNITFQAHLLSEVFKLLSSAAAPHDDKAKAYFYRLQAALVYTINVLINTATVAEEDEVRQAHKGTSEQKITELMEQKITKLQQRITELMEQKNTELEQKITKLVNPTAVVPDEVSQKHTETPEQKIKEQMERRRSNAKLFKAKIRDCLGEDFVQVLKTKTLIDTDINEVPRTGRFLLLVKRTAALVRAMIMREIFIDKIKSDMIIESLQNADKVLSGVDSWEIFDSIQRRGVTWIVTLEILINDIKRLLN